VGKSSISPIAEESKLDDDEEEEAKQCDVERQNREWQAEAENKKDK
jgi:hypothetical protein